MRFYKGGGEVVKKIVFVLAILVCLASGVSADRPKVGLVLAGGGAKGFAQIGVLKVLEDNASMWIT